MKTKLLLLLLILITNYALSTEKSQKIYYGKILSIESTMGYQYLKVQEKNKEIWVAIANAPVKVGDKIGYDKQTVMKDFKSKSLKRSFKEVIFASEVYLPKKDATHVKDLQDVLGLNKTNNQPKLKEETSNPAKPFEKKAFYTVEEIFMWKDFLKDQNISVKGKVSKVSKQIMKLDWVHIQDGTGDASKNNEDLVFTIKEIPFKAGESVIATGKLIIDKDFGYGYFYKVIIQESSLKKQ